MLKMSFMGIYDINMYIAKFVKSGEWNTRGE